MNCLLIFIAYILHFDPVISFGNFNNFGNSFKSYTCGQFESLRRCACSCNEKCENKDNPNNCPRNEPITTRCFCISGFYRNSFGKCVIGHECYTTGKLVNGVMKCGQNEVYAKCGNLCKNSCDGYIRQNCVQKSCDNGCFCDQGLFRNNQGQCVPSNQCLPGSENKPVCGENQVFAKCGNLCKNNCNSIIQKNSCPAKSCDDGCFCNHGFWKNDQGVCVSKDNCKIATNFIEMDSDLSRDTKVQYNENSQDSQDDLKRYDEMEVQDVMNTQDIVDERDVINVQDVMSVQDGPTFDPDDVEKPIEPSMDAQLWGYTGPVTQESSTEPMISKASTESSATTAETTAEATAEPTDETTDETTEKIIEWEKSFDEEKPIEPSKDGPSWEFNGVQWSIVSVIKTNGSTKPGKSN